MALVDCPDCGNPISTDAYLCPACGRPTEKQRGLAKNQLKKTLILWIALVTVLTLVWFFMGEGAQ